MYPACNTHAPYCHLCPTLYNIFPHYLINGTILGETLLNTKCVLIFCTTFVWNGRTDRQTDGQTNGQTDKRTDRQTNGRTDMTKLIVAYRSFTHAPKIWRYAELCLWFQASVEMGMRSAVLCDITQRLCTGISWQLKMEHRGCPETSVRNCHLMLRDVQERRRSLLN